MPGRPKRKSKSCGGSWLGALAWATAVVVAVAWGSRAAAAVPAAGIGHGALQWAAQALWAQKQPKAPGKNAEPGAKPAKASPVAAPASKQKPPAAEKPAAEGGTPEEKDKVIVEHADKLRYDGDKKVYRLEGNVRIRHKDTVLTCDWAEYYEDTDKAIARGHLLLKDPETTVTGDVMSVDFTDEVAVVEGNVIIVSHKKKEEAAGEQGQQAGGGQGESKAAAGKTTQPGQAKPAAEAQAAGAQGQLGKPAGSTARPQTTKSEEKAPTTIKEYRERKTTVYCSRVRYRYTDGEKYAWITGPIRAEQKDRTAWADRAEYDVEDGVLKLFGNVRVKTSDGDEFQCPTAIISVDEEWLRAEKVSGVAIRKKKKKGEESPAAAESSQGSPEPGAAGGSAPAKRRNPKSGQQNAPAH